MKTVLITGANRGIGLGLVQFYLESGWSVIACSRQPSAAKALQELAGQYDEVLRQVQLDVGDEQSIQQLGQLSGPLDLLINNAGVSSEENIGQWTTAGFEQSFRVNAAGPALVVQALAPLLHEGAKVVNITSGMGSLALNINPGNGLDAYAMSKAALNAVTQRMAGKPELKGRIVICMNPGWIKTDMGGDEAPGTVEEVAAEMAGTIAGLTPEQSGQFLSAAGERMEW
ncbi:SDR family oxidoreductase [Pontiellaceae bacterium B12227]|nr:SDR family oxidoreductase [Pontiellaceae bacterium B12227]